MTALSLGNLKATPAVVWPTATGITYGQALSASTLSGGESAVAGTFAFTTPATTPGAGTYSASVTFTPTDTANYTTVVGSVNVAVARATPTLSVANSPVTYNGSAQAATVNGSVPGTASNVKYNGSATVPTAVGTYAITADFAPTDSTDYNSLTGASAGNFVINPGALDHFAISTISSPQTAGTAITGITLTAQDAYNNTVTSFASTVAYSGTAGITGTSAAFTAGVLSGVSVTPTSAGTGKTFIVTGSTKTGTSTFNVNPGAIASYAVSAAAATRGTAFNVTVTAKDANNNTVTTDSSTVVTLTSSTGNVQFDSNGDSTFGDNSQTLSSGTFTIST